MKILLSRAVMALAILCLSSCGDSVEKLNNDQISLQDDITETLNAVANGDLSSSEATSKLDKLSKKGKEISQRRVALVKDLSQEDLMEISKKNMGKSADSSVEYSKAFGEVTRSGKMTPEILIALTNAISSASRSPSANAIEVAGDDFLKDIGK